MCLCDLRVDLDPLLWMVLLRVLIYVYSSAFDAARKCFSSSQSKTHKDNLPIMD